MAYRHMIPTLLVTLGVTLGLIPMLSVTLVPLLMGRRGVRDGDSARRPTSDRECYIVREYFTDPLQKSHYDNRRNPYPNSGTMAAMNQPIAHQPKTLGTEVRVLVRVLDWYGKAALLWSRDFVGSSDGHYKALDFCRGVKPYVLIGMDNNMGTTTQVSPGELCPLHPLFS